MAAAAGLLPAVVFFIAKRAGLFQHCHMLSRMLLKLATAVLILGMASCCCLF